MSKQGLSHFFKISHNLGELQLITFRTEVFSQEMKETLCTFKRTQKNIIPRWSLAGLWASPCKGTYHLPGYRYSSSERRGEGRCGRVQGSYTLLVLLGRGWRGRRNSIEGGNRVTGAGRAPPPSANWAENTIMTERAAYARKWPSSVYVACAQYYRDSLINMYLVTVRYYS
jgi:hypothetical protein